MTYNIKKNIQFFYKKRKRTQRSECSFIKNGKERKDRNVLLKRTDAHCPTLLFGEVVEFFVGGVVIRGEMRNFW